MKKTLLPVVILLISCSAFGRTPYEGPMRFSTFWPCNGNASFCGIRILAEGTIQPESGRKFETFLRNRKQHKQALPPRPTVVFDSPGGSVIGGMELGRVIRKNKLDTEMADSYSQVAENDQSKKAAVIERAVCASACVIAFSGGMTRSAQRGARLGIHQFSGGQGNIGDSATQVTVVVLASYFEEMGINRSLLDRASLVPASSIAWVSESDAKRFRLDNTAPYLSQWKVTPTEDGVAVLEVLQEVGFGRSVSLRVSSAQGAGVLTVETILEKSVLSGDRIGQFPENELPEIDICTQTRCIQARPVRPWARRESTTLTAFQAIVSLSSAELLEMSKANRPRITDNFGNAASDVSLSTELSTIGLAPGIALLLRQR